MEGRRLYVKHPSYNRTFVDESQYFQHDGKSVEDGAPGPGSGRYPLGSGKRPYQHRDGTLNLLGKIRYRTTNKYHLMSDDDIRKSITRKGLEKDLDEARKKSSTAYRIASKLGSALEEVGVSAAKKVADRVVNHYIDKGLEKFLGEKRSYTDDVKKFAESLSSSKISELNNELMSRRNLIKNITGSDYKGPLDYKSKFSSAETPPAEAPKPKPETPPAEAPKPETPPAEAPKPKPETPPAEAPKPKPETPPAEAPKKGAFRAGSGTPPLRGVRVEPPSKSEPPKKVESKPDTSSGEGKRYSIGGTPPSSPAGIRALQARIRSGELTVEKAAKQYGVSEGSIRYLLSKKV